jgi:hypothetical protein
MLYALSLLVGREHQAMSDRIRVQTKFDGPLLSAIDAYRREQLDPPSRAEAIRQLCDIALAGRVRPTLTSAEVRRAAR